MRLLVITHSYPPALTPRALRWAAITDHWASKGYHVDVVCAREAYTDGYQAPDNGVRVFRVGLALGRAIRRWTHAAIPPRSRALHDHVTLISKILRPLKAGLAACVKAAHNHIWKKLYWPDYACTWYLSARNTAIKLVMRHRYDALISVSLPYTDHLVGLALKKRCPSLPWIADTGDPFAYMTETPLNNLLIYGRLNYRSEIEVLSSADAISVTAEAAKDKYTEVFPVAANKLHVVPPLFYWRHGLTARPTPFSTEAKKRLVYVGTLYRNIRSPETLLWLYARLLRTELAAELELHFFGALGDCGKFFEEYVDLIGNKVFLHGLVEHDIAMQAMMDAAVLVNIGNDTAYQLPSKLIEYASVGKPILNVTNRDADSSVDFLRGYPRAFCVTKEKLSNDPDEMQKVKEFIISPPDFNQGELARWLCKFSVEVVAQQYEDLIANISHPAPDGLSNNSRRHLL
jgi:hypothetical protein